MQKATDLNSTQRFGRAHPACQLQPNMNSSQRAPTGRRPYSRFPEGHKDSSHRRRCALAAKEEYYRLPIVRVPHPQLTNAATIASSFRRPLALINERWETMLRRISTVAWAAAAWDPAWEQQRLVQGNEARQAQRHQRVVNNARSTATRCAVGLVR